MRYIIWQNINLNIEDWREDLEEKFPEYTEEKLIAEMYEVNNFFLEDNRAALNIELPGKILAIGELDLWFGHTYGYKELSSNNVKDCLYSNLEYVEWYVSEDGELRFKGQHYYGTNYCRYRMYKADATDEEIDDLKEKICCGKFTEADLDAVTEKIGTVIANVYGWTLHM